MRIKKLMERREILSDNFFIDRENRKKSESAKAPGQMKP